MFVVPPTDSPRPQGPLTHIVTHIGGTPLVPLDRIGAGFPARILAKCEHLNPGGSIKDRIALAIVDDAERSGRIRPGAGDTLVEATPVVTVLPDSWDRYRAQPWTREA